MHSQQDCPNVCAVNAPTQDDANAVDLLGTSEVAALLGVSPNTVTRWARERRLPCLRTLGGHHRFDRAVIEAMLADLRRGRERAPVGPRQD